MRVHGPLASLLVLLSACTHEATAPTSQTIGLSVSNIGMGSCPAGIEVTSTQDLGSLAGSAYNSIAYGVNNSGDVVGETDTPGNAGWHAALWRGSSILDLGTLGGRYSEARDVNDAGIIVGSANSAIQEVLPVTWTLNGAIRQLPTPPGTSVTRAADITEDGFTVATTYRYGTPTYPGSTHVLRWTPAGVLEVDDAPPGDLQQVRNGYELGVNANGDIVGMANQKAFLRTSSGQWLDLGTLGGDTSYAVAINSSGLVTGWAKTASNKTRAFIWQSGGPMRDLGALGDGESRAWAINEKGEVVGESTFMLNGQLVVHGFYWSAQSGMVDLGAPSRHSYAHDISESGQIAGAAESRPGTTHAFLWGYRCVQVNRAPVITGYTVPASPIPVNSQVEVSASFADPDVGDVHIATIGWDDGSSPQTADVTEQDGSGVVRGTRLAWAPGVYEVSFEVTDPDGAMAAGTAPEYLVIYDPEGGFVTGGGWIMSPPGAYQLEPSATGKATFGFVARYQKGAKTPTGNTNFEFSAAGLHFQSSSIDWLVVQTSRAQYKGEGTINGGGLYGFLLTAIDGDLDGGVGDRMRVKIWDRGTGAVVYDNHVNQPEGSWSATELGGGNISIKKGK